MRRMISVPDLSLPASTTLETCLFQPAYWDRMLEQPIPLPDHPPEDLAGYLRYQQQLIHVDMQDEITSALRAIETGSHPFFNLTYQNKSVRKNKENDTYTLKLSYEGDAPNVGDIILIESTEKQRVIVKVSATDPKREHLTAFMPKWMDATVWASGRIVTCRGYLLVSLSPLQRCYDAVQEGYFPNATLDQALLTEKQPIAEYARGSAASVQIADHLNSVQREAIRDFLELQSGVSLWMAPAGTGKTTAICEAIRHQLRVAPREQVLVVAPSNKGVITVMEKFHQTNPDVRIGYIGSSEKLAEYAPHLQDYLCDSDKLARSRKVLFSTLNSSAKYRLTVSAVIFDEAGQSKISETRIPFKHNPPKMLLVGDPLQLPPTVKSERIKSISGDRSLLDILITSQKRDHHFFSDGYRMDPLINTWVSHTVYNNRLTASYLPDVPIDGIKASLQRPPYMVIDVSGVEKKAEQSYINKQEAAAVVGSIRLLLSDATVSSIAVITPYQGQVEVLKTQLSQLDDPRIQIGTVDGFQGSEADVVLVSMVRANNQQSVGFANDPRRLNVALTRAKRNLFVFINTDTFTDGPCRHLIQDATSRNRLYTLGDLKNKKRLIMDAMDDRLYQLRPDIFPRVSLQQSLVLGFQTYRYAIQSGYLPTPVKSVKNHITIRFLPDVNPLVGFTYGVMYYRWNGGLGKPVRLLKFDPNSVRQIPAFGALPEQVQQQLSTAEVSLSEGDFTHLATWFRHHVLNDAVSPSETTLARRISTQGSRIPLTVLEQVPVYVQQTKTAQKAIAAFEEKRYEDAAVLYQKIIAKSVGDEKAWATNLLAWALHHQYGRPHGLELAQQAILQEPWETMCMDDGNQCRLYATLGYMGYHRAMLHSPPSEELLHEALEAYHKALAIVERDEGYNLNQFVRGRLAKVYIALHDYAPAVALCDAALIHNPADYIAAQTVMEVAVLRKDLAQLRTYREKALEALRHVFQNGRDDPRYLAARAQIDAITLS